MKFLCRNPKDFFKISRDDEYSLREFPGKALIGVLFQKEDIYQQFLRHLETIEMGSGLYRNFLSLKGLYPVEQSVSLKNETNSWENEWKEAGKDVSEYPEGKDLMSEKLDDSELAKEADSLIQSFQKDAAKEAGIFHHLITLPTYHETALGTSVLSEGYFGDQGMLAYVREIQRQEIRREMSSVKHQDLAGSTVGDTHKEYFSGDNALLAGGKDNTMNQF